METISTQISYLHLAWKKLYIFLALIFLAFIGIFTEKLDARVNITTIDAFKIYSINSDHLMISKKAEFSEAFFYFEMNRPYCLCQQISFLLPNPDIDNFIRPAEDSTIKGSMRVDFKKNKDIEYEVYLAREDSPNNVIIPQGAFPSIREAKILEVSTTYGKAKFILEGFKDVMRQATKMCESWIPYQEEKVEAKEVKS